MGKESAPRDEDRRDQTILQDLNMGSLTIIRTKDQLAISTAGAFTALDEVGSATVSTAAVIPSGVSKIVNVQISAVNDGAEETLPVVLFSGNALPGGDTYALGGWHGEHPIPETATTPVFDSDIDVISGNSLTISATSLDAATFSIAVLVTMQ